MLPYRQGRVAGAFPRLDIQLVIHRTDRSELFFCHDERDPAARIDVIHTVRSSGQLALVETAAAGIGEPVAAVRMRNDVVRCG
jgi:hypothetical protein